MGDDREYMMASDAIMISMMEAQFDYLIITIFPGER